MIHHVSVGTSDLVRARAFYDAVLAVLDLRLMKSTESEIIYGAGVFLFSATRPVDGGPASPGNGVHIAFAAEDRATVDRFYVTALSHGGAGDGEPGLRPNYDANYYGAFVHDPDGNKIEAVTYSAK